MNDVRDTLSPLGRYCVEPFGVADKHAHRLRLWPLSPASRRAKPPGAGAELGKFL